MYTMKAIDLHIGILIYNTLILKVQLLAVLLKCFVKWPKYNNALYILRDEINLLEWWRSLYCLTLLKVRLIFVRVHWKYNAMTIAHAPKNLVMLSNKTLVLNILTD